MVTSNRITGEWADRSDNTYMVLPVEVHETILPFLIQPESNCHTTLEVSK